MDWREVATFGIVIAFFGMAVFLIKSGLDPIATVGLMSAVTALAVQLVRGLRKSGSHRGKNKKKGKK
ncbi:hypothetical protein ACFWNN_18970 [Lentzea sp. NPDC058450]|uniref:hypothetical protein n=1 Tax=Lentzea sp. NPDC058450 TaxID=3346505 RepID=UPI00364D424D